jgi:NADH-quinone oxidoreductase subunit N
MELLYQIAYFIPEILLALFIPIFAILSKKNKTKVIPKISKIILFISFMVIFMYNSSNIDFQINFFTHNTYTHHLKILLVVCCFLYFTDTYSECECKKQVVNTSCITLFTIILSLMMTISANNLFIVFLGLELYGISICFFILDTNSKAAKKYLIISAVMSAVFLYGASLYYSCTGSMSLFSSITSNDKLIPPLQLGILFMITYFLFKMNAAPFHTWSIFVYNKSSNILILILDTVLKLILFIVFINIFNILFINNILFFKKFLFWIAIASMIVGGISPYKQNNIKKFIAYSSIGHIGLALIILSTFHDILEIKLAVMYVFSYCLASFCFFTGFIGVQRYKKIVYKQDLAGIFSELPFFSYTMFLGLWAMVGIPPFFNFLVKFNIFRIFMIHGDYVSITVVGVYIMLTAAYTVNFVRHMYVETTDITKYKIPSFQKFLCILVVFFTLITNIFFNEINSSIEEVVNLRAKKDDEYKTVDIEVIKKDLESMLQKRRFAFMM